MYSLTLYSVYFICFVKDRNSNEMVESSIDIHSFVSLANVKCYMLSPLPFCNKSYIQVYFVMDYFENLFCL